MIFDVLLVWIDDDRELVGYQRLQFWFVEYFLECGRSFGNIMNKFFSVSIIEGLKQNLGLVVEKLKKVVYFFFIFVYRLRFLFVIYIKI